MCERQDYHISIDSIPLVKMQMDYDAKCIDIKKEHGYEILFSCDVGSSSERFDLLDTVMNAAVNANAQKLVDEPEEFDHFLKKIQARAK